MLQDSQRSIQNKIDSLTQQTSMARWYNSQLATELPSGRPNSAVRTVATNPGLPWELEMPANQAAHVRTILRAKNILPTLGASSSNQLFTVSHPPESLKIHPPIHPNPRFLLFSRPRYGRCQYRARNLPTIIRFLQPTDGIFIPKLLPGHTSWYPHVLFADIPDIIGTPVPILHWDSMHHAYLYR